MQKREYPNTRIMLGFAAKIMDSVKATQLNSDFIAEQFNFKQRHENFYNYFIFNKADDEHYSSWIDNPFCQFI